jgi:hypothetical protein
MNYELRPYQKQNALECGMILTAYGIVYMQHTQRTGKTLTALETARLCKAEKVLFLTKKKAIESIKSDYNDFNFPYELLVTNYESLHKVKFIPDLLILDEAHSIGAFPKPSQRTKLIKQMFADLPMIFLSGTPASESYSQWYHQLWVSNRSPFKGYANFYKWAKDFTIPSLIYTSYGQSNDYSKAIVERIDPFIENIVHKFTQENAGFTNKINKKLHFVEMKQVTYKLINQLKKDKFIKGNNELITADSGVKIMSKQHQLGSGTIIFDSGNVGIIDDSKAVFIRENFTGKLAIFYYFKEELNLIKQVFGETITTDINEFNNSDKHFVGQQYSNAMGVNLSKADKLIYLNFGFSGTNWIQSLDRLTTIERKESEVHILLAQKTIDFNIFQTIEQKKNFTLKQYESISK